MPDVTTRDIATRDVATRDVATRDINASGSTILYQWNGESVNAQTGDAMTPPSIGDAARNRMVLDWENRWVGVKAEELRIFGARRVENLNENSEDLTAGWSLAGSPAPTIDDADTVTFSSSAIQAIRKTIFTNDARDFVLTAEMRVESGTFAADAEVLLGAFGNLTPNDSHIGNEITSEWQRFECSFTTTSTGNTTIQFRVAAVECVLGIRKVQLEDVTGQTNQNPSEYVSTGVLSSPYHGANVDGVKYFATENGNTVSSNVVTEATGDALTTIKGYMAEGAATELSGYSADLTNAAVSGNAFAAKNAVGLTGAPNEAFTITDSSAVSGERTHITKTITADGSTYYYVCRVKYNASPSSYPFINIYLSGGTTRYFGIVFDPSDGSYNILPAANQGSVVSVSRQGDFWTVIISATNNSTNTSARIQVYPAFNEDGSTTEDTSAQGSHVVASAELYKTNYSFSPILTTGGTTKTRLADTGATLPVTFPATEGSFQATVSKLFLDALASSQGLVTNDSSDAANFLYFPTTANALALTDGTNTDTATSVWSSVGESVVIKARWSGSDMQFFIDGMGQGSTTFDGDFNNSGSVTLFKSLTRGAAIKSLTIWSEDKGNSWGTE